MPNEFRAQLRSSSEQKLDELKQAIAQAGFHPLIFGAKYDAQRSLVLRISETRFSMTCCKAFAWIPSLPALHRGSLGSVDEFFEEDEAMEAIIEKRSEQYITGSGQLHFDELRSFIEADGAPDIFVPTADAGSKSVLLAKFAQDFIRPIISASRSEILVAHGDV